MHYAAYEGNVGVVKLLLAHPQLDVNTIDNCGFTALHGALHIAAQANQDQMLDLLLGDPRLSSALIYKSKNGVTPVMAAVKVNNVNALQKFLDHPGVDRP